MVSVMRCCTASAVPRAKVPAARLSPPSIRHHATPNRGDPTIQLVGASAIRPGPPTHYLDPASVDVRCRLRCRTPEQMRTKPPQSTTHSIQVSAVVSSMQSVQQREMRASPDGRINALGIPRSQGKLGVCTRLRVSTGRHTPQEGMIDAGGSRRGMQSLFTNLRGEQMMSLRSVLSMGTLSLGLLFAACGDEVNLDKVPSAKAGCADPTAASLAEGGAMLPGRNCVDCHKSGGQAAGEPWSTAGTVFSKRGVGTACDSSGADAVTVELLDATGKVVASTTTNSAGNFYFTSSQFSASTSVTARVKKGAMTKSMLSAVPVGSGCATCHNPTGTAGDRIFIE